MDLCERINSAKCCAVELADAYVKASNYGDNTDAMLIDLLLVNSYVKSLENYECEPEREVTKTFLLTDGSILLTDNGKVLSLKKTSCECVDPDEVNCLTKDQVCAIMHEIALRCDNFICGC